jgi:molecular chaperone IbpA
MTSDIGRLFDRLESLSVGLTPMLSDFRLTPTNYPPHNIIQLSDNETILELAVAGFKKDEITVSEESGIITIKGEIKTESEATALYQYRGIAKRSFVKTFKVFDRYKVSGATLEDGMLRVCVSRVEPDEPKIRLIPIE